jgi:hypothetical protein
MSLLFVTGLVLLALIVGWFAGHARGFQQGQKYQRYMTKAENSGLRIRGITDGTVHDDRF